MTRVGSTTEDRGNNETVPKRYAVIDIGTNSVRLLVGDVVGRDLTLQLQAMHQPRLGQDVERTKRLSSEAMRRTLDAVGDLLSKARAMGAGTVTVVGTSALRDAANRKAFLLQLRQMYAVDVVVLTGEEEAALSFYGAVRGLSEEAGFPRGRRRISAESKMLEPGTDAVSKAAPDVYVLDIGGGSTELAYGTLTGEMLGRLSVDVGAVRMKEKCLHSDPPSDADWRCLHDAVTVGIAPFRPLSTRPRAEEPPRFLAVGGTATTLAAVDLSLPRYDGRLVHGHAVSRDTVANLLAAMRRSTGAERRRMPAMQPERADIIVAGTFIMDRVLHAVGVDGFTASEADLLVGVLWRQAERSGILRDRFFG